MDVEPFRATRRAATAQIAAMVTIPPDRIERCPCGSWGDDDTCAFVDCGYPWCRPCQDHHRGPECAIDHLGRALNPYTGKPWD